MSGVQVVAPTLLEYWAARRRLPRTPTDASVAWAGVGLRRWQGRSAEARIGASAGAPDSAPIVVCGLAGALKSGLPPGTVLVPETVGLPDGRVARCDGALVERLVAAARALRFEPETGPLLTVRAMVVGAARREWAGRGFVAADMETGLLAARHPRVATVRVVLDSPERDVSAQWLHAAAVLWRPALWRELVWLCRAAPAYALRAADVVSVALARSDASPAPRAVSPPRS